MKYINSLYAHRRNHGRLRRSAFAIWMLAIAGAVAAITAPAANAGPTPLASFVPTGGFLYSSFSGGTVAWRTGYVPTGSRCLNGQRFVYSGTEWIVVYNYSQVRDYSYSNWAGMCIN